MKLKCLLSAVLCLCLLLTGCGAPQAVSGPEANEKSVIYVDSMDTFMTLTAYGSGRDDALKAAENEIRRLNDLLSVGVPTSEIAQINANGTGTVSGDTARMVRKALELYRETSGAFDITVYPIMELWGFTSQNYHVPSENELSAALEKVGSDRVTISTDNDSSTVTLGEGQAIDLGGIAKGFTSQRIMEVFRSHGLTSAMVSLGGNVQCLGTKPDGTAWRVGVRDPEGGEGDIAAVVEVVDRAVITSGGYERFFTDDATGITYKHIVDPSTGIPVESGISSVTIVTPDGMLGDGLSTALYIMGLEKAAAYWAAHSDSFEAIIIDDAQNIYITEGLRDCVSSQKELHLIKKQ